jgi:hypothetical protein
MESRGRPNTSLILAIAVQCAFVTTSVVAQSYIVIDVPGAGSTQLIGINNAGDVVGHFCPTVPDCSDDSRRSFVRESNGNLTTFDGLATSINDAGTVTGYVYGAGPHLFVRSLNGNTSWFDIDPPYPPMPAYGVVTAIDNRGDVAGYIGACPMCDKWPGFIRDRKGTITTFFVPRGLIPTAINARGDITGHTASYYMSEDGFVRSREGEITMFDVVEDRSPGPRAYAVSINNAGDIAGHFYDPTYGVSRGFVRQSDGNITIFDAAPSSSSTTCASINERGDIAGDFYDVTGPHNFLRNQHGDVTVFDVPNAFVARVAGVNNRGEVAGYFLQILNGNLVAHGFVRGRN